MIAAMPTAFGLEYGALGRERDPELRGEGLLSLASRQERTHRSDLAIEIYNELLSSTDIPQNLRERARRHLDAHRGEGRIGDRVEILLSRFTEEVTEPTNLLAMTAAGLAFRTSRFIALSRLAANPSAGLWTRGLGARALAGLTGFGIEALTFPLAGRLANVAWGREQDWSLRALSGELASSFLILGALRAGGLTAGALTSRVTTFRPFLQQAGMYGGILLGHGLEVKAGLREGTSLSTAMVDGLSTLLQFNVAGRLNRRLLGEGFNRWEREIDRQSEALGRPTWRLPQPPSLGFRPAWNAADSSSRPLEGREPPVPDRLHMASAEDGKNGGNGGSGDSSDRRRKTTLPGLSRPSRLPENSRRPLFLQNADYRVPNLSLRAREIVPASPPGPIQVRMLRALEEYLGHEKDPVVLVYPDTALWDTRDQGQLRIDLFRYFSEFQLPDDFTLTVVVPTTGKAVHYSRNPDGGIQMDSRDVLRRSLSRESGPPPRVEIVNTRPGSRPDSTVLKSGMEKLLARVLSETEQNPAMRLEKGHGVLGKEDLESLAETLSSSPPPTGRRFTLTWWDKGGGQVTFQREGEVIRAELKAHHSPPQTFWYLPSQAGIGHFQFFADGEFASYAWQAEPGYSQTMDRALQGLWTRMGVTGSFEKAGDREEGAERRGTLLARVAQHWVQTAGPSGKTWQPQTLENLLQIHQTLELAQAHLDLGLVRRFQERMGRQALLKYKQAIESLPPRQGETRLVPLDEMSDNLIGIPYLPLDEGLKAAFVQQLYYGLQRPRFPTENYRLLRDPRRLGQIYRETLRGRIIPLLGVIQLAQKAQPEGGWAWLLKEEAKNLDQAETQRRADIEFFLAEIPEHARILRLGPTSFHREFLREIFSGDRALLSSYVLFRHQLDQLPVELRVQYRIRELPTREELDIYLRRTGR